MYGTVNRAIEDMVVMHHGEPIRVDIKAEDDLDVYMFIGSENHPNETTYRLVGATSTVLDVPTEQVLIGFGEHWVTHSAQATFGGLMQATGKALPEPLRDLPDFHAQVALIFPDLHPRRFECSEITDGALKLHCYSRRHGPTPFVVGLLPGPGKMFKPPVTVHLVDAKIDRADHDVLDMKWQTELMI